MKVLIVERNGVDLEDNEELDLKEYVIENSKDHHSGWDEILPATVVVVKERKQMVVFDELKLDGSLFVDGKLVIEV